LQREVGGDPPEIDGIVSFLRNVDILKDAPGDNTSFGNLSVQIKAAARSLGYDPARLTISQRSAVITSLSNPKMNIYIAAKYLSDLRVGYLPSKDDYQTISEREMQALAGAYNFGAVFPSLDDFWKPLKSGPQNIPAQYGVSSFNGLKKSGCWDSF
jgi:hypothetical protein